MRIICVTFTLLFFFFLIAIVLPVAESMPSSSASPVRIELKTTVSHLMADDIETVRLTAYVYDDQGNPAPDGTRVNFTIGNEVSNAYTGGFTWSRDNGSFAASPGIGTYTNFTEGGCTSATFGWVPTDIEGTNSTIWAYINGANIHSAVKIYFSWPTFFWTGQVVNSSGAGYGGIPVTLHFVGYNGNGTPYEIYNMTRMTSSNTSSVGKFAFDPVRIVMSGDIYGYVDAEVTFPKYPVDNNKSYLVIYNKSADFSLNWSNMSIGTIVLETPPLATTTVSPTITAKPSPKPSPAFEIAITVAGLIVTAYIFARREN